MRDIEETCIWRGLVLHDRVDSGAYGTLFSVEVGNGCIGLGFTKLKSNTSNLDQQLNSIYWRGLVCQVVSLLASEI